MKRSEFQARIYKLWRMRHVNVPEELGRALAVECARRADKTRKRDTPKHIPVVASVNGRNQRTTLTPAGGGRYRLQFNAALRRAAQADAGDWIGVSLRYDAESREIALPADLRAALREHPKVWKEFLRLPPGHRRQMLLYYLKAKSPRARERATLWCMDHLLERALLGKGRRSAKQR